jgi:hypothetical protein
MRRVPRLHHLRSAVAPYRFRLFAVLVVAAVAVNLAQFRGIDRERFREFEAVGRYETSDVARIAYENGGWHRQRYGLYLGLGTLAPGATVYIPTPSGFADDRKIADETESRLRVFGRAGRVEWVPAPAVAAGTGFDPRPFVVASGVGGARGAPWALAVDPALPRPAGPASPDDYLKRIVTGEGARGSAGARTFALIRWPVAREGEDHDYQELLVETALLPASLRAELPR